MEVSITNWKEYQHRKDVKVMHWFRVNADIMSDPKLFKLSVPAKWLWICLLSICAKEKQGIINVDAEYLNHMSGVENSGKLLESLELNGLLKVTRTDPIRSDRVQNEQNRTERTEQDTLPVKAKPSRKKAKPKKEAVERTVFDIDCWKVYAQLYRERYGTEPVRNAKINGQLTQLVKRLGGLDAPHVVEFYLSCSDNWIVRNFHPLGYLLQHCETFHTRWKQGVVKVGHKKHQGISEKNQEYADFIQSLEAEEKLKLEGSQ